MRKLAGFCIPAGKGPSSIVVISRYNNQEEHLNAGYDTYVL